MGAPASVLRIGDLTLDSYTFQVTVGGRPVHLSWTEFHLLKFLMTQLNRVHARDKILAEVWDAGYLGGPRTVDVHIRRLRFKLGEEGERCLKTVRNIGYGLEALS